MVNYCCKGLHLVCLRECWLLPCCIVYGCHVFKFTIFSQLLLSRLWLVIVSLVFLNFVLTVFKPIFLYWYSHYCNNEKSKFVKRLFLNLITVEAFYCRYVIDKDIVESFYKESLFFLEYSLSLSLSLYMYIHTHVVKVVFTCIVSSYW